MKVNPLKLSLAAGVALAFLAAQPGEGQTVLPPSQGITYGKQLSILPEWLSMSDTWERKRTGSWVYYCIRDSESTQRHVLKITPSREFYFIRSGKVLMTEPRPPAPTYAELRLCWTDLPPQPLATGEPLYYSVMRDKTGAINWPAMNQPNNIAGTTTTGEPCEIKEIISPGFYFLERKVPGFTRCRVD